MMPVNLNLVNFSLNIKTENREIKDGFKAIIIEARLAVIKCNPENKKKLYPTMPVIPINRANRNSRKLSRGNFPNILKTMKTKKKEAKIKRKKVAVNGEIFKANTLPATGVLPKNIVTKKSLIYMILFLIN